MTLRKGLALVLVAVLCFCATGCNQTLISPTVTTTATVTTTTGASTTTTTTTTAATTTTTTTGTQTDEDEKDPADTQEGNGVGTAYPKKEVGFQLEKPAVGEEIVILHTTKGNISIRLFPEAAPKAVENFVTHAKNGYFDGQTFYCVINDFLIQAGDPTGDGNSGESIWGKPFEDEFDQKLLNLNGAVSMAGNDVDDNKSQFFINQCDPEGFGKRETYSPEYREKVAKELWDDMVEAYGEEQVKQVYPTWQDIITDKYIYEWIPDEVWELYEKNGGNIHLDGAFRKEGGRTVFGQVFEGMDVVKTIGSVVTDSNYKPSVDVVIKSAEVTTYKG